MPYKADSIVRLLYGEFRDGRGNCRNVFLPIHSVTFASPIGQGDCVPRRSALYSAGMTFF
jgi:hypothetical protein